MSHFRENILWVVTTQWRGQALGCAGDANAQTPHLDALARCGVRFENAVTNHPFGPFARAALMTGKLSPRNGVRDYFDPLPYDAPTIARSMQAAGYATAFFGKWHLAKRDPSAPVVGEAHARTFVPEASRGGFDFWEGFESGFLLNDPWLHGTEILQPQRFEGYQADVVSARFLRWLETRARDRDPWFAVVSLESPHPPYAAATPSGDSGLAPEKIILRENVPLGGAVEARARTELSGYYRHIAATDAALGRVFEVLGERAAIFVTSAHGDMHGSQGVWRKGWPYEEAIRVPLIAKWAGCVSGSTVKTPVSLLDLPQTARSFAGEKNCDDLRALNADVERRIPIGMPSVPPFAEQCPEVWRGVRLRDRVYVCDASGAEWLFYDLANDPFQKKNLVGSSEYAEQRAECAALLRECAADFGD